MVRVGVAALRAFAILSIGIISIYLFYSKRPDELNSAFVQDLAAAQRNDKQIHKPLAKQILASELLSRPPTYTQGKIPEIFHQSWKSLNLPKKFDSWSRSCRQKHGDWAWVIWTDEDNLRLVQMHFPWLEETYRGLPSEIYRADLARYLYMYAYGGVYADLDTECLRPTEYLQVTYGGLFQPSAVSNNTALFGRMGTDPDFEHSIPNAWMAAAPGHPFFLIMMKLVRRRFKLMDRKGWDSAIPERITGPIALRSAIAEYKTRKPSNSSADKNQNHPRSIVFQGTPAPDHDLILLPSHVVYPFSWGPGGEPFKEVCWVMSRRFDANKCKKMLETEGSGSISITYWSHTHTPFGHNKNHMKMIE